MVPIPASPEDEDGGGGSVNADPVILDANPQMPGPITINMDSPFPVSLTVRDANKGDTLYVRVFRDYAKDHAKPLIERTQANDATLGKEERQQITLETGTWCQDAALDTQVIFDVVVADRPFNTDAMVEPVYRAVTAGGRWSISSWVAKCVRSL